MTEIMSIEAAKRRKTLGPLRRTPQAVGVRYHPEAEMSLSRSSRQCASRFRHTSSFAANRSDVQSERRWIGRPPGARANATLRFSSIVCRRQ
jgi:hypothetical protein